MLKIIYTETGNPKSDSQVLPFVNQMIQCSKEAEGDITLKVSNELVILTFLLKIKEGIISEEEIKFYNFNGEIMKSEELNQMGSIYKEVLERLDRFK